ncbi:MAG: hypothetical protein ACXVBY_18035, partial [Isosphaeraceae bacterium]
GERSRFWQDSWWRVASGGGEWGVASEERAMSAEKHYVGKLQIEPIGVGWSGATAPSEKGNLSQSF